MKTNPTTIPSGTCASLSAKGAVNTTKSVVNNTTSTNITKVFKTGITMLVFLLFIGLSQINAQTTVFQFDFESGTTPSTDNAVGTPSISNIGTLTSGTSACSGTGYSATAWDPNDAFRFTVNTTGYTALVFNYQERASNAATAIGTFLVRASTDGSSWTTIRTAYAPPTSCTSSGNISLPAAFENVANVFIEILKVNAASSTSDRFRIDDATLTGTAPTPTKLVITAITPTSPFVSTGFSVTVQSQDAGNVARNVTSNTNISLAVTTGPGTMGGTTTGTINNGSNSVTINNVTLNQPGTYTITASRTSGMTLTAGVSSSFIVGGQLAITTIAPASPIAGAIFSATVQSQNASAVATNVTSNTNITLSVASGPGTIGGTTTGTINSGSNSVTINNITLSTSGTYVLTATRTSGVNLTAGNSASFVVQVPPPNPIFRSIASTNWTTTTTWESSIDGGLTYTPAAITPTAVNSDGVTIRNGHTVSLGTSLSIDDVVIDAGGTLSLTAGVLTVANGALAFDMSVNGTVTNTATSPIVTTGAVQFGAGSMYTHAVTGSAIPLATWNATSTCNVTGTNGTGPSNLNQNFGNFIWNCASQGSSINWDTDITTQGDFTFASSGTSSTRLNNSATNHTFTVGGNFIQTGGTFDVVDDAGNVTMTVAGTMNVSGASTICALCSDAGTCTTTVNGNITVTNGSLRISEGAGIGTLNAMGDVALTGGNILHSSGTATLNFNKAGTALFTSGGAFSGTVNVVVSSATTLQFGTGTTPANMTGGSGTFNVQAGGTLGITNTAGITTSGATGNVQSSGTRTYTTGANYIYNGAANQAAGNGLSQNTPANITIANTGSAGANTVTLSGAVTMSGNMLISSGNLDCNASNFAINIAGNWTNNGGYNANTGTVTFNGAAGQTIGGSAATTFRNLNINDAAGVTIGTSPNVAGTLTFTNGKINTGSNNVTLTATGTSTGATAARYINGNEVINIPNAAAPSRKFDIGDATAYAPITLAFVGTTSGSGNIAANTSATAGSDANDNSPATNSSGIDQTKNVNRTWLTTNTGVAGFTSYSSTLGYAAADIDGGATQSTFVVRKYDSSPSPAWTDATASTNPTSTTSMGTGFTSFSSFQVGNRSPLAVSCPSTVNAFAGASCNAVVTFGGATSSSLPTPAITYSPASGSTFAVGTTVVTVSATNINGTQTCTFNVVVTDNTAPAITCPATANITTSAGSCTSSASIGTATATDNCSATVSVSPAGPYALGSTTVTWMATDASGNTSTCSQIINVTDATAPAITCPATANISTDAGVCTSSASIGTASATDNCGTATVSGPIPAGPYSVGTTTVTWSAMDAAGNTAACTQMVIVSDNQAPVISCPSAASISTDAGACTSSASIATATATDNCGTATVTHSPAGPYSVGTTTVIWMATDAAGNTAACTQTVTVTDSEAPTITCPTTATISTDAGICTSSASIGTATASDNCSATVSASPAGPYSLGSTSVIWTATDAAGNTAACTQIIIVVDNQAPSITCPATATISADAGVCTSSASIGTATASDNCGAATVSGPIPAGPYSVGATSVTWMATDAAGNTAACTQMVIVTDNQAPSISCPATANINTDAGSCTSSASIGTATASDNCGGATVSASPAGPYAVGTTTVTWIATDAAGNTAACTQTINVTDNQAPSITCSVTATISTDAGACTSTSSIGTAIATDNCGTATVSGPIPAGPYSVGSTSVTYTATDAAGNTAACTQIIIVMDNQAPTITCPATATLSTDAGSCTSSASIGTATASDNCSVASVVSSPAGPYSLGTTSVTWMATDVNGNTSACTQMVIVMDNEAPSITCLATANINTDAGSCTSSASIGSATATDNCGTATVSASPAGPYSVGTHTIVWTAIDASGNTAACTQTVNVTDNQAPSITCPATATLSTNAGVCTSSASIGSATASDNCGTAIVTGPIPAGPYSVGSTTVTWMATDAAGNTAACTQMVIVMDNQAPTITCPATATLSTDAGSCTSSASIGTATATDNCLVASVTASPSGPYSVGTTSVTWMATDVNGNTAACTQMIIVTDGEAPSITCPATANISTNAGSCTSSASIGTATASDNCGTATVTSSPAGPYSVGTHSVTWMAMDAAGNTAACTQTVIVSDNEAPSIICPATANITVDSSSSTSSGAIGTATATDNCGSATVSGPVPAGPYPSGITTVIWTATDAAGNSSTCSQIVSVTTSSPPVITCPAIANITTDAGICTSSASIGTATATDDLPGVIVTGPVPAGPYSAGTTTVIWTATDINSNISTCAQIVVVTDAEAPTATAPTDVTVCSASATAVVIGTATGTDNCAVATVSSNAPAIFSLGTTVVIWTVIDVHGNTATASQNVTVNAAPVGTPSTTVICNGSSTNLNLATGMPVGTTFSWTATNTFGTVIGYNGCASGCGTVINDVLSNLGTAHGTVVYSITPTSALGCAGAPYNASVTVGTTPAVPVAILGPAVVCGLPTAVYSVVAVADATTYTWTVPSGITGMTILSGQGTTAITVSISAAIPTSLVTVTAGNACGTSAARTLTITRKPLVSGPITGPNSVCGLTTASYSIVSVFGATSYTWNLPAGITIASGAGTTGINVNIAPTFAVGNMSVTATNACGSTAGAVISIVGQAPGTPGTLAGPTNVCGMTTATYSIPGVANATGYSWTVPSWMTIAGGAGTTSITVMASGTPAAGTVSVAGTNVCGTGTARSVTLTIAAILPGSIAGPTNICGMSTAAYSVLSVGTGYTYNWVLSMTGWSITSGAGTTMITCAGPPAGTSTLGLVKVTSTNSCGNTSGIRTLAVTYCHSAIANVAEQNSNTYSALYPNPTSGEFKLDVTTDMDEELTLQVYDVLGNLIIADKHQVTTGTSTISTNLESYKAGLYFIRLMDGNAGTVYSQTVVKQ